MRHINIIAFLFIIFSTWCEASQQGISYQQYTHDDVIIQILTLDPQKVKIVAVRAQDTGRGLGTVENIAKHFSALAGINGGFFRINKPEGNIGLPAGVLKINNQWHGIAYKPRAAIGWDPESNQVLIDRIQTESKLSIGAINLPIHATNLFLDPNKGSLFSDSYTEKIDFNGNMAILINGQKVQKIYSNGSALLRGNTYMYSVPVNLQKQLQKLRVGDQVKLQINVSPQMDKRTAKLWNKIPYIVGGGPVLIKNKQIINDYSQEKLSQKFINGHFARTAIGILPDNKWVLVVVERNLLGLLEEQSGWTLAQLSEFMQTQGCIEAINLDGGHSSMMYVQDQLKTSPQNGYMGNNLTNERQVSDVLLVLPR